MNIWVNGCFDILHAGHIKLLWYAKLYNRENTKFSLPSHENKLYVGLDTDERVKRLKGNKRPINDLDTRLTIMSALRMVDDVFVFDTDDQLRQLIRTCNIDYMVIGDQYRDKKVIGVENSKHGVVFFPVDKMSTTNIIERIKNL